MLPLYWSELKLGEVADYLNGRAFKPKEWEKTGLPIIRIQNLNNTAAPYNYSNEMFEDKYLVKHGELLFAWSASLGAYIWKGKDAWLNQHIFKVIPKNFVQKLYLYYYLGKVTTELYAKAHGSGMVHVTKRKFEETPIVLPPLPEQRAIVSKIEQLFSELDNGITNLKLAQEQLKVYRQAVLDETSKIETFVPITEVIEELGQGWSPKCHKEPSTNDDEWGVIKTTAIQAGYFNEKENKKLPLNLDPKSQHELSAGDILITRAGPRVRVGVCCLVKKVRPRLINCDKAYRIKLKKDLIVPEFFEYTMNSAKYTLIKEDLKTGISDSGVNLTQKRFLNMKIPLPTILEQQAIVREIETRLSVCDKMEQDIAENLEKAEVLRQSILKKAFEGKLLDERELEEVRNAPDWEPAEKLLERVKAEKKGKK